MPEWGFTGKHTRLSDNGKAEMTRFAQNWAHLLDSMVICYFATVLLKPRHFCQLLNAATGSELTPHELLVIGDRINALHRAYNYRCGVRRSDDTLPLRAMTPLQEGGAAGAVPDLAAQLDKYYQLRRWEPSGKPSRTMLLDLGSRGSGWRFVPGMRVRLRALGAFRRYLGDDPIWLVLTEGADLNCLMDELHRRWGEVLPHSLWDSNCRRSEASVMVMVSGRRVDELTFPSRRGGGSVAHSHGHRGVTIVVSGRIISTSR